MISLKKIIMFFIFLLPWFLSSLIFKIDYSYYNSLNLPNFVPPNNIISIIWIVIYICISINISIIYNKFKKNKNINNYYELLITNYILNQLFIFSFFTIKSLLLSFLNSVALLVSTIWLYTETKKLDRKASYFLLPYLVWTIFATIISIGIYLINP